MFQMKGIFDLFYCIFYLIGNKMIKEQIFNKNLSEIKAYMNS